MKTFLGVGSGPGIGLATAERFAREGFRIVLSGRNPAKTATLAQRLTAQGYEAHIRTVDAGDPSSVASMVVDVERSFDGIDVMHYNAASMRKAGITDRPATRSTGTWRSTSAAPLPPPRPSSPLCVNVARAPYC